MKSTFSVIFYLKRQVVKKDGTVPVMGRITVDGSQTQFSCKLSVDPKLWDTKGGRVTGRSTAALETNRLLDKMRVRINKHYQEIMERDNYVTAEKVKNAFLGLEHRYHTLMQVFNRHNEDYEKQVEAGMKAKATLSKYKTVYKHLQEFLNIRYHVKDIALKELTPAFISDFEMFLRTDDGVHRHQQRVAHARPVPGVRNQEGGNDPQLPDERRNTAVDGRESEERQAGTLPRPIPVLRIHGLVLRRYAQSHKGKYPNLLRRP